MPRSKKIKNDSKLQRRMDSLSRILSVESNITPCIAVAFIGEKLFITFNTPRDPKEFPADQVRKIIRDKLELLRDFLSTFNPHKAEKMTLDYYYQIRKLGGTGVLSSMYYENFKNKHTVLERVKKDLLKLAEFYQNSPSTDEEKGFSLEHTHALWKARPEFFFPNAKEENAIRGKMHAEQLILQQALKHYRKDKIQKFKIIIGINKLACQVCEHVLDQHADKFSYRGRSGKGFPNVINIITKQTQLVIPSSSLREDLFPNNSDSEPEFGASSSYQLKRPASSAFFSPSSRKNRKTSKEEHGSPFKELKSLGK